MSDKKGGSDDGLGSLVLGVALLAGLGFFIWAVFGAQITEGVRWLRMAEMLPVDPGVRYERECLGRWRGFIAEQQWQAWSRIDANLPHFAPPPVNPGAGTLHRPVGPFDPAQGRPAYDPPLACACNTRAAQPPPRQTDRRPDDGTVAPVTQEAEAPTPAETLACIGPKFEQRADGTLQELQVRSSFLSADTAAAFLRDPRLMGTDAKGQPLSTWMALDYAGIFIGDFYRVPLAVLFGAAALYLLFKSSGAQFRTKHGLESLIAAQAAAWKVIAPFVKLNPATLSARAPGSSLPASLPPFAEALAPDEWIRWAKVPVADGRVDRAAATARLAEQLGPRWDGLKGLPDHVRALVAAFALKGARKRSEADDLLGEIAACYTVEKGLRLTPSVRKQVATILADKKLMGPALKVAGGHAFRASAMLALLAWARKQGGVLAPASFVWLRGQDRALWYPLNNLGRQSFHAEAAGAMAHHKAETMAGRPLTTAKVEAAVAALDAYLQEAETLGYGTPQVA